MSKPVWNIYKTNLGIFLKSPWGGYSVGYMNSLLINGESYENAPLRNGYYFLEGVQEITKVEQLHSPSPQVFYYELISSELSSDNIPLKLSLEGIGKTKYNSDDDVYEWEHYNHIRPLYKAVYGTPEKYWKKFDLEIKCDGEYEITDWKLPEVMTVRTKGLSSWDDKVVEASLASVASYYELDKILVPEFLIHKRPCFLSSQQMYKIVRQYIIDNIDRDCAIITSNYDFCFTVKRLVHTKPVVTREEILRKDGRRYATPKFKTNTVNTTRAELFEMTWAGADGGARGYKGYTIIEPLKADSLQDLHDSLKAYLDELMYVINTKTEQCSHCNGHGTIVVKFPTNK